ncbi:hypothetical protein A5816_000562 [Enterococcus sp. 3G1_DIV0629]|uniref:hypothetical protein n=1 Tax=Enterococcus sp. (strain 3G1_DIV0629) TaxID=1834176 RepID=UPI000A3549CF|nr:hypothetical protein [Enterococcus sp. 3G1_DIV0629]OTO28296.1 hypothetical protein A5816_000562 [Enterococcus sp. 3G1_DIV0629]
MSVSIDPQEMYVWLACEDGYHKFVGHVVEIDGIKFSIVPMEKENGGIEIVFSDLKSGSRLLALPIHAIEVALCNTKERTLAMFNERVWIVKDLIHRFGRKKVIRSINEKTMYMQIKYGEMPAIEVCHIEEEME